MHSRDSLLLTSLFVIAACSPAPGTTTADSDTTDGTTASTGNPDTTGEPTSGTTGEPTTGDSTSGTTTGSTTNTTGESTTGDPPLFPETCADVKADDPGAGDGEYTLYIGKDANKPWTAYCHDMDGAPKEYLTLVNVEEGRNYSMYKANDPGETDLITRFTRVRLDPVTLIVDIDDLTFSTSEGMVNHGGPTTSMPYAVAEGCAGDVADGSANVDLVGTPFKVIDPFCTAGATAVGEATFSMNDQVVDLTGGGFCGWTGPMKGDKCVFDPQAKTSGFVLDLEYVSP